VIWGQAAAAGLHAVPGSLESHYARFTAPHWNPATIDAAPGWAVLEGYLKRHPTCAHLHGVNDAVEDLVAAGPMTADSVARVEVHTYAAASAFDEAVPRNGLSARFSIPCTVATGLVHGDLGDRCFAAETLADERLRSLARRVQVRADPELEVGYPDGRPATVVVHRTDGSVLTAHADRPRGMVSPRCRYRTCALGRGSGWHR
jgi:2-methylcitrate dehydratase PrpD